MEALIKISYFSLYVAVFLGVIFYPKNKLHKWFLVFLLLSVLIDQINSYVGKTYGDNLWVFKIFLVLDFVFFTWYYSKVFDKQLWPIGINYIFLALILAVLIFSEFLPNLNLYLEWFHFLIFVFFIIQAGYALIYLFKTHNQNLFSYPVFWISFGRMFYYLMIIFIFVYPKFLYLGEENEMIWKSNTIINSSANTVLNFLYAIAFICPRMKK